MCAGDLRHESAPPSGDVDADVRSNYVMNSGVQGGRCFIGFFMWRKYAT